MDIIDEIFPVVTLNSLVEGYENADEFIRWLIKRTAPECPLKSIEYKAHYMSSDTFMLDSNGEHSIVTAPYSYDEALKVIVNTYHMAFCIDWKDTIQSQREALASGNHGLDLRF